MDYMMGKYDYNCNKFHLLGLLYKDHMLDDEGFLYSINNSLGFLHSSHPGEFLFYKQHNFPDGLTMQGSHDGNSGLWWQHSLLPGSVLHGSQEGWFGFVLQHSY